MNIRLYGAHGAPQDFSGFAVTQPLALHEEESRALPLAKLNQKLLELDASQRASRTLVLKRLVESGVVTVFAAYSMGLVHRDAIQPSLQAGLGKEL